MRLLYALSFVGLALSSSSAFAAETYLSCSFVDIMGKPQKADLALNAATRSADVYFPSTGAGSQWPATFAPKMVTIHMGDMMVMSVDRVTMKLLRLSQAGGKQYRESGSCKKTVAPKRAF